MTLSLYNMLCVNFAKVLCTDQYDMQISEVGQAPGPAAADPPCRFPKLEECAHFHYERVQLPQLAVTLQTGVLDQSLHSQHTHEEDDTEWFMVQVTSGDECWLLQRNIDNFKMLDDQLHQCIFDRKISQLRDLSDLSINDEELEVKLIGYLERFSAIANNSVNCGPVLNWLQMDNKGHRLLVPSEESRSINTPAVAAAYSIRRYVSQARDELNLEVGDMISVIDMASPGESMWWRGKRGFQVGFFPQHCVHIIGDKVPRNMPLPPPVVGSLALTPIKPVLRKHGKLITFFRSFILNRPTRRRLKQSGILKERVFGCDLGEHLLNSGHDIPMVLKCCAEFIEKNGIVDGIYRLSGITSNIQKLRNTFDEDRVPNLFTEEILQDIHSVASLLKMYFRELPNPLCTYQLYQSFVDAVQGCSTAVRSAETDHERLLKMRESVQKLPPPHYRTLEYLMRHLANVAKHGASTGMTTRNLAIVWAPNLLRCEALEVGGVAALQGVGVQAVVTEFLICYADLIFCDHLPNLDLPELAEKENTLLSKKCRPNSLAISTPTKLITLEEARSKHLLMNKSEECGYIEVGGGPKNLPKKYHTIIELPAGSRKRGLAKRSPLGWRLFFSKNRNASQGNLAKNRKASTPITINEKSITESDLTDMKRKLRSVKSAESLTSGHSELPSSEDVLGPLHTLNNKPPGHNRSVSHDSYFDTLQNSQNNSEGSLLDLSEIHLNFDLEESEMRIFSEDESLVSSPRNQKDTHRRILMRSRPDEFSSANNSVNPSPKKQARVVLSPESMSRKRTRLEDQLSDIQYIDCATPDSTVNTTAVVHSAPKSPVQEKAFAELYQPKNKSPRNSDNLDKRQSLNLENAANKSFIPKSFTEVDINRKFLAANSILTTPTPGSPGYKTLGESSANTTPGFSPNYDSSPSEITYHHLNKNESNKPSSANYENVLTTISITYKSPPRSKPTTPVKSSPVTDLDSAYENVFFNADGIPVPASDVESGKEFLAAQNSTERPKSLSALEESSSNESTIKANSSSAICNTSDQMSLNSLLEQQTLSSNRSSGSNIQYTASYSSAPYHCIENSEKLSPTDLSLSEVVQSSTENLSTSQTSLSFPATPSKNSRSPNVSQDPLSSETRLTSDGLSTENLMLDSECWSNQAQADVNLIDLDTPSSPNKSPTQNEKRKSDETESSNDADIYQQVKYFRRSIHEVNALLDIEKEEDAPVSESTNTYEDVEVRHNRDCAAENCDSLETETSHVYENLSENMRNESNVYENIDIYKSDQDKEKHEDEKKQKTKIQVNDNEQKIKVKDLKNKFEEKSSKPPENTKTKHLKTSSDELETANIRQKKVYDKDGLPPCLRVRNLKSQLKTRSLDEEEFYKEFGIESNQRRKSLDEDFGYKSKTNSLPKTLNQPKSLPMNDTKVDRLHMTHSNENLNSGSLGVGANEEEIKKRERIEKYKEERRKILSEKYRSESFKEDKDVLLSRLKIFKAKEEASESTKNPNENDKPPRVRRRSTKSECSSNASDSLDEDISQNNKSNVKDVKATNAESLKCRAAIFEQQPNTDFSKIRSSLQEKIDKNKETDSNYAKNIKDKYSGRLENKLAAGDEFENVDFIRNKRKEEAALKDERRHTYDSREREPESERLRRITLENNSSRKEKTSPTYCIKDVKAIFERKSTE